MAEDPRALQFDRAEYREGSPTELRCALCGSGLGGSYYAINGRVACEKCKANLELARDDGGGVVRFLRASLYGSAAGLVGAGIWYGIRAVTGLEIGLIAIVVGLMVGGAVRKGANGRGGWSYQALAMFLTYGSIVSTYVPMIVGQLVQNAQAQAAKDKAQTPGAEPAPSAPITPANGSQAKPPMSLPRALFSLAFLAVLVLAFAFVAPFLAGFHNIVGLFIIAIGVYEAWKINRRMPLQITGPHSVNTLAQPVPDHG